jgi:ribosomal-protein-alanine N-acetyltransferase
VKERPIIHTARLMLRPFCEADARAVQRLAGEREVASTTLNIPHPYEDGVAAQWIGTHREQFERGESVVFAVVRRTDDDLVGAIELSISPRDSRAELGYWIGKPFWNNGYCTEAARAIVRFAFEELGMARVTANHVGRNPASGRVMQKAGMMHEGRLRRHVRRWGQFEDLELYGILKEEYRPREEELGITWA